MLKVIAMALTLVLCALNNADKFNTDFKENHLNMSLIMYKQNI